MAFGLIVLCLGIGVFAGSRLGSAGASATPAPSTAVVASPAPTGRPATPKPSQPAVTPAPTPSATNRPTLAQLVGQKLIVRMDGSAPSDALLERARRGEIGGVVLFRFQVRSEEQLRSAVTALQDAAADGGQPPLLVMIDQEGGGIRGLTWAQPVSSATRMGARNTPDQIRSLGAAAGKALKAVGVNVDLAPVADVPGDDPSFMRDTLRTWSTDPEKTGRDIVAFAEGLASQHILATVKHFPGIGRVARNTDRYVETVRATRDELDRDLVSFRAAIDAGVPLVMLSNATYSALDRNHAAGWSAAISDDLLRGELGFGGVTVTDSLSGTAAARKVSPRTLALDAARAGVDLLMISSHEPVTAGAYDLLLARATDGSLDRAALEASYARILALKATLGR
jgi:beta-N-acetylhexosaminidase